MKVKTGIAIFFFFIVAGVLIGLLLLGPSLQFSLSGTQSKPADTNVQSSNADPGNAIVRENSLPGTSAWRISSDFASTTQIQGYAGAASVKPGASIDFYVSTQKPQTLYDINIYRLGWYQGEGGRLMTVVSGLSGDAQGYYNETSHTLAYCQRCHTDPATGLLEANWKLSYTLHVPSDWTSGIYLAKLTDEHSMQSYIPFDVLGSSTSTYVAVTPDTTYEAYNDWGGTSLYDAASHEAASNSAGNISDRKKVTHVSFDRPYALDYGSSQLLDIIIDSVHWFEREGYDISYASDVDVHENAQLLSGHKAYISLGHDEYWTKAMREHVETARAQGIGLAFMGANAIYWQMRFAPDAMGKADRTIICYKVETPLHNLANDPEYGVDNSIVTSPWRDPVVGLPENALIGVLFSDLTHSQNGFPWRVDPAAGNLPLLKGTGLKSGQEYGCGVVGYEWDKVYNDPKLDPSYGSTEPKNLHIISTSNTISDETKSPDTSNSTYYVASSGAFVFATGSIYWGSTLDAYRWQPDPACGSRSVVVPGMQSLMKNVMDALIVKHNPNGF